MFLLKRDFSEQIASEFLQFPLAQARDSRQFLSS